MWPFGRRRPLSLGEQGEQLAREHLTRHAMKLLARNYRCPHGEVDIIALDISPRRWGGPDVIVFVEVKTRRSDAYVDPESAVNAEKQRRIRKVAEYYLLQHQAGDMTVRFDVVSIVMGRAGPRMRYIREAF